MLRRLGRRHVSSHGLYAHASLSMQVPECLSRGTLYNRGRELCAHAFRNINVSGDRPFELNFMVCQHVRILSLMFVFLVVSLCRCGIINSVFFFLCLLPLVFVIFIVLSCLVLSCLVISDSALTPIPLHLSCFFMSSLLIVLSCLAVVLSCSYLVFCSLPSTPI
jgi:hypothetical protein